MNVSSEKEISALKLYIQVLGRRWLGFLAAVNLVLLLVLLDTLRQPKVYESSLLLLIGKEQKPQVVDRQRDEGQGISDDIDTQIQVLATLPILSKATDSLRSEYPELDASSVSGGLSIKQLGKSGIVSVSYRDTDPKRLVKVLSQLGETYVNFSLANRRSQVASAVTFIENKLPSAQRDLEERSQQLAKFRRQNNLIDPSKVGETLSTALAALNQEEYTTIAALRQGQALYTSIEQRLGLLPPDRALAVASLSQDEIYRGLLKDYQEAEKLYALGLLRFTDQAPSTKTLKNKRDELKRLLAEQVQQILGKSVSSIDSQRLNELQIAQVAQLLEAENTLRVQQARLSALQSIRSNLEGKFKLVPDLQQKYDSLSRNLKVASDNVTLLLTKLEEFRILEAQESAIWKVVQLPYPPEKPVSPNLKLSMIVGLVLGLMAGGLVVYIREQLDNRLRTVESVNNFIGLQTLGILPKVDSVLLDSSDSLLGNFDQFHSDNTPQQQYFLFQTAIQTLLLKIQSIDNTGSLKVLGFTSTTSREGKSVTAKFLGICASELGYKVLVIDSNFRQPKLHLSFNIANHNGLSDVIQKQFSLKELVQETYHPGLYVLPSGSIPSSPLALLNSSAVKQVMAEAREEYDLILVDLPSLDGSPELLAVANLLDGFVLLVNIEVATRKSLETSLRVMNGIHSQAIGFVCNMAPISEIPYSNDFHTPPLLNKLRHKLMRNPLIQRFTEVDNQQNEQS